MWAQDATKIDIGLPERGTAKTAEKNLGFIN